MAISGGVSVRLQAQRNMEDIRRQTSALELCFFDRPVRRLAAEPTIKLAEHLIAIEAERLFDEKSFAREILINLKSTGEIAKVADVIYHIATTSQRAGSFFGILFEKEDNRPIHQLFVAVMDHLDIERGAHLLKPLQRDYIHGPMIITAILDSLPINKADAIAKILDNELA